MQDCAIKRYPKNNLFSFVLVGVAYQQYFSHIKKASLPNSVPGLRKPVLTILFLNNYSYFSLLKKVVKSILNTKNVTYLSCLSSNPRPLFKQSDTLQTVPMSLNRNNTNKLSNKEYSSIQHI